MKKRNETIYQYGVIFNPNGAGYTVIVPKLPGLITEGNSLKEAREMARDAIRCYLGAILKENSSSFSRTNVKKENLKVAI